MNKPQKSQYLPLAILGIMLVIFGVIDILMLSPAIGVILAVVGAAMALIGWNRHKTLRQRK